MKSPQNATPMDELYGDLPPLDFSRHVLQESRHEGLRVMAVPSCGWSDLGTPERIAETLRRIPSRGRSTAPFTGEAAHISLAERHRATATADSRI
jgi:hypothetical protein